MIEHLAIYLMLANVLLRIVLTVFAAAAIALYYDDWWPSERLGMGFAGGAGFLTVPVIIGTYYGQPTPFDDWAATLMSLGFVMFLGGRLARTARHAKRNAEAKARARAHLQAAGKI